MNQVEYWEMSTGYPPDDLFFIKKWNKEAYRLQYLLPNDEKIVELSTNAITTLIIGTDDKLYKHEYSSKKEELVEMRLPRCAKPKQVSVGYSHMMILTTDNELYTWGDNTYGQLGGRDSAFSPVKFPNGVHPVYIEAGRDNCRAKGDDGNIYAWGRDYYDELLTGIQGNKLTPTLVKLQNK